MSSKNLKKSDFSQEPETVFKVEKTDELQSLDSYVDDRLELIRQIFSSLQPKTIKNLAPAFLKETDISAIEELCLNELLGISTKRLKAIINGFDCPSNTDSSDSDVENIEENIPLHEVSSESNLERGTKTKKKKKNKNGSKLQKKIEKDQHTDKTLNENGKEISVLELLELQARARAIRSQLALEPVAKIEVDSEGSGKDKKKKRKKSIENKLKNSDEIIKELAPSTSAEISSILATNDNNISDNSLPNGNVVVKKRIKLKRNFRKRSTSDINDKDENTKVVNSENLIEEKEVEKIDNLKKIASPERSQSPDVLPIINSPEVLCISDTSEDEKKVINRAPKVIENILLKGASKPVFYEIDEDHNSIDDVLDIETRINNNSNDHKEEEETVDSVIDNNSKDSCEEGEIFDNEFIQLFKDDKNKNNETIESGEISWDDASKIEKILYVTDILEEGTDTPDMTTSPMSKKSENEMEKLIENPEYIISSDDENDKNSCTAISIKENESEKNEDDSDKNHESDVKHIEESSHEILTTEDEKSNSSVIIERNSDSNDHNDDVISLNDDEDIELALEQRQIKEEIENKKGKIENKTKIKKLRHMLHKRPIELNNSSTDDEKTNDEDESTSWNNRWLRSSKVSKIMATSKLGRRLRDKVLNTKVSQLAEKQSSVEEIDSGTVNDSPKSNSDYIDGSVQQYIELVKLKN